ncbi:DUF2339 domain-containing protein [Roseospira goensis]|uniref:Putative membrane protein n=1 Tax=Roseospira goensis TaxID=391922 RepID=A0A7W6RWG8_9PROT|nr:DUF2339 domain-containing protein [Roseospira goensis]MBB4284524.1 putative membrane protein [Roseospira goensis]
MDSLFLLAALLVLGPPLLAIWALVWVAGVARDQRATAARLARLEAALAGRAAPEAAAAPPVERAPETGATPAEDHPPGPAAAPEGDAPFETEASGAAPAPGRGARAGTGPGGVERALSERWLIWLGGVALALGGAFLVKYAVDEGWLTEALRCVLGGLLGFGLLVLGAWVRQRSAPDSGGLPGRRAAVALTAAGLSSLFASLYAAHGLYGLIGAPVAFVGLGAVALAGLGLALLHGPFVAGLGLLGGYAVPALVQATAPAPEPLFGYLLALTLAAALLPRWRPWPWTGALALAGNTLWLVLFLAGPMKPGDEGVLALFLLAAVAIATVARVGLPLAGLPAALAAPRDDAATRRLTEAVWAFTAALLALMALATDQAAAPLAALLALTAGGLWIGGRDPALWGPPTAPVAAALVTLAGWDLVGTPPTTPNALLSPPLPDSVRAFLVFATAHGALVALGAHLQTPRTTRPMAWAGLATATPLLLLAVAYWRVGGAGIDLAWAALALALGGLSLLAAGRLAGRQPGALGVHAVGVLAAVAIAAALALEQAWLTVALSLTVPAVAWVEGRLGLGRVPGLRGAALVMAALVLVRLVLNPYVLDYPIAAGGVATWLLYGYGVPALAFAWAARAFLSRADGRVVMVLEGGAVALAVLLVSLQVRHLMAGPGLAGGPVTAAEWAAHVNAWLLGAVLLQGWRSADARIDRPAIRGAEIVLAGGAALAVLVGPVTTGNPVLTGDPVGSWPLINLLLPLYGTPAALLGGWAARAPAGSWPRRVGAPVAVGLLGLWLTLCVRHGFAGSDLSAAPVADAELYAYSVLWLLFAVALLGAGARLGQAAMRRAGLGLLLAVTLKVFLVDMAQLTGLWRALSFLGLGAALVGLGALTRALERRGHGGGAGASAASGDGT